MEITYSANNIKVLVTANDVKTRGMLESNNDGKTEQVPDDIIEILLPKCAINTSTAYVTCYDDKFNEVWLGFMNWTKHDNEKIKLTLGLTTTSIGNTIIHNVHKVRGTWKILIVNY